MGIAIWDEQGVCILTNESKVLTDVQAIGTNGSDSTGFSINTTLAGNLTSFRRCPTWPQVLSPMAERGPGPHSISFLLFLMAAPRRWGSH